MDTQKINELIQCLKRIVHMGPEISLPELGFQEALDLKNTNYDFTLYLNRKGRKSSKFTLQLINDNYKSRPLLRLDIFGPAHQNPEGDFPHAGETIPCPHLHVADPDFGLSIAYPLNGEYANMYLTEQEISDLVLILKRFLERCNVANIDSHNYHHQMEFIN